MVEFFIVFFIIIVIIVVVIAVVTYSGNNYYYNSTCSAWTFVFWFFFIWFIIVLLFGCNSGDRCDKPVENLKPFRHSGYYVSVTNESPLNVQLTLDKWKCKDPAVLNIVLNGNEVSTCCEHPLSVEQPAGYNEVFNVVIPAVMNEMTTTELLYWKSPNGTVLTAKWVSSFDNIFVTLTPCENVKFL